MRKITAKSLKETLGVEDVSRLKTGEFKFFRGFFYTHGQNGDTFAKEIEKELREAYPDLSFSITDSGTVWKPFRGGDTVRQGSHFYVVIKFDFHHSM